MSNSRSGRVLVYPNEIPFETDVLYSNMYRMVDVSNLAQAVLGGAATSNANIASGLACTQNSPLGLSVIIGSGVIYSLQQLDATAYSTIPADTSDMLYKPFSLVTPLVITGFTAPVSGTTNWLIQALPNTLDIDSTGRQFFNPSNPSVPVVTTVNQTRVDKPVFSLKQASSPSIPTPDAGNVGLYVVSVASGQTTIVNSNISVYNASNFINSPLPLIPSAIQKQSYTYISDTGAANAYVAILNPAANSLVSGLTVSLKISNSNTGPSTLNVNGLGAISILNNKGAPLFANDLRSGQIAIFVHNGTNFLLQNPLGPSATNFVGASMYMNSTQPLTSIIPNFQTVAFNSVTGPSGFDPFSMCNTSTNTITIPFSGYWRIEVGLSYTNTSANNTLVIFIGNSPTSVLKRIGFTGLIPVSGFGEELGSNTFFFSSGANIQVLASVSAAGITVPGSNASSESFFTIAFVGN